MPKANPTEVDMQTGEVTDTVVKPPVTKVKPNNLFASLNDREEHLNVLFYGREGSGKTTAAASLVNTGKGKVLVINAEAGLKKNTLARQGIDVSRIMVWPANNETVTHAGLIEVYTQVKADLEKDPKSWIGVVLDSATEIVPALIDQVSASRIQKAAMKGLVIDGVDGFFTDISDYGTMTKMFRDLLRKFRDLPTHFVITALERRDVDEDTGKVHYGPAVTPSIQTDLLGFVDLVMTCFAADEDEKQPFRALTRAAGKYRAKDRLGILPLVMVDPSIPRILQYEAGTLTEDKDPRQKELNNA
jgi:hypothetical protein